MAKSMKKITSLLIVLIIFPFTALGDDDLWESKGPHVRIKRNDQDGSYIVFERTPDDRRLVKTMMNQNDQVEMKAVYYRNPRGFLTTGRIHDGRGTLIFRVVYGYDKQTGLLVAEDMFDARVKRFYPPTVRDDKGERVEMPIRRVYYFYDADGNQAKAMSLVPRAGKTAEEIFTKSGDRLDLYGEDATFSADQSTAPTKDNPFEDDKLPSAE